MGKKKQKQEERPLPAGNEPKQPFHSEVFSFRVDRIFILLLIGLTFLAYASSFTNDFVWDDNFYILRNESIRSASHLGEIFTKNLGYGAGSRNDFYRPLQELTFLADYHLYGLAPWGYHLTNTLLHALVAIGVFLIIMQIFGNRAYARITSILFAIHPIQTEAVTYIAGRADSLYVIFFLISMSFFIAYTEKKTMPHMAISLGSFILALLSKEIAFILPAYLLAYLVFSKKKDRLATLIPYVLVVGLYILARSTLLNFGYESPETIERATPLLMRLATFTRSVFIYLGLLILPVGLHMQRDMTVTHSLLEIDAMLAIAGLIIIGLTAYRCREKEPVITFGIVWFFLGLLPVSNIYPINAFAAEHWVYLSSVGFFLVLAAGFERIVIHARQTRRRGLTTGLYILSSLVCLGYLSLTALRNPDWKSDLILYQNILVHNSTSSRVRFNLARYYENKRHFDRALHLYEETVALDPSYHDAVINMAGIYLKLDRLDEAAAMIAKASVSAPDHEQVLLIGGMTYLKQGKYDHALQSFQRLAEIDPSNIPALISLGDISFRKGDYTNARRWMEHVYELEPDNVTNLNNMGSLYATIGESRRAATVWKRSLGINPDQPIIQRYLKSLDQRR